MHKNIIINLDNFIKSPLTFINLFPSTITRLEIAFIIVSMVLIVNEMAKNIIMLDRKGVLYRGRDGLNQWKSGYAIDTKKMQ